VVLKGQANAATPMLAWQGDLKTLAFSSTTVGQTSGSQTLTLNNTGTVAAVLSGVSLAGTDAASFAVASTSTCKANASLAANASCTVVLSFSPASAGAKSATLKVTSNATSLGDVVLSGSGMAPSTTNGMLSVNKTALDFSATPVNIGQTSAAQSLTVTNGNVAAVTLSKAEVTGPFKITATTCPVASSAIAVNATCTVSVAFMPTASGMAMGSLTLTTATGQMLVTSLQGLSVSAAPVLAWQTGGVSALQFDSTEVGRTSAAKSVTLVNQGPGAVTFTALEATGTDAAQFSLTSASTCRVGSSLAQGATCQPSRPPGPAARVPACVSPPMRPRRRP
jgi:trimeric autotransporter adhesin